MVRASLWEPAIRLCGGDTSMGVLLNRLEFFHERTTNVNKNGDPVTIRTYAELAEEFGWTKRKAKTKVSRCKIKGYTFQDFKEVVFLSLSKIYH